MNTGQILSFMQSNAGKLASNSIPGDLTGGVESFLFSSGITPAQVIRTKPATREFQGVLNPGSDGLPLLSDVIDRDPVARELIGETTADVVGRASIGESAGSILPFVNHLNTGELRNVSNPDLGLTVLEAARVACAVSKKRFVWSSYVKGVTLASAGTATIAIDASDVMGKAAAAADRNAAHFIVIFLGGTVDNLSLIHI